MHCAVVMLCLPLCLSRAVLETAAAGSSSITLPLFLDAEFSKSIFQPGNIRTESTKERNTSSLLHSCQAKSMLTIACHANRCRWHVCCNCSKLQGGTCFQQAHTALRHADQAHIRRLQRLLNSFVCFIHSITAHTSQAEAGS